MNSDWRKKYLKTIDNVKSFVKTKALINFLKDCIVKKVIPKTFEIKHAPDQRFSDKGRKKWADCLKNLQVEHLKISIKELQKTECDKFQQFLKLKTELKVSLVDTEIKVLDKECERRQNDLFLNEKNKYKSKLMNLQIKAQCNRQHSDNDAHNRNKRSRRFLKRSKYRRKMKRLSKAPLKNLVINYSDYTLTEHDNKLLNRHLTFVPLTDRVNKTLLQYEFNRFARTMRWREYFGIDPEYQDSDKPVKIFNIKKHNLPKAQPSRTLNNFLYGIQSDLFTPDDRKVRPNISKEEKHSLQSLVNNQKNGDIVIQRADKGGAIVIMNRNDYIKAIEEEHLSSTVTNSDGIRTPVYRPLDQAMVIVHHNKIKDFVESAVNRDIIDKNLGDHLITDEPAEARAYGMPKVHKGVVEGRNLPPLRLVISGCGSNTENISHYVNHITKDIPSKMESFIQDTPHFLRLLEEENAKCDLPDNAFLVSIDVVGLYPNIPQDEGIQAFKDIISDEKYRDQSVPSDFLITLLQFVLTFNSFVFNGNLYLQEWGTAIGTKLAPVYANIFMAVLEKKMLNDWKGRPPNLWKRYIDDIFSVFIGKEEELLSFIRFISSYHHTIKFTCEYRTKDSIVKTCWKDNDLLVKRYPLENLRSRSVDFLDCNVWINENSKFETDLFVKETDCITYLMPSSCHPKFICKNIPYSLGYRLKRICSSPDNFDLRIKQLKDNLLSRGYKNKIIDNAFDRLKSVSREQALKKVVKNDKNDKIVCTVTYDPRIVCVSSSIEKHFSFAQKDPEFKNIFPEKPVVGYRRGRNLGDYLIRSKLYPLKNRNLRARNGFYRCDKKDFGCSLCRHSMNITEHIASFSGKKYPVKSHVTCSDSFVIYSIQCKICPMQYVGQTTQQASKRFNSHFYDVVNKNLHKPVAKHFNSRGHSASDIIFTPFEKLYKKDKTLLDIREKYWILEKDTVRNGLNKMT